MVLVPLELIIGGILGTREGLQHIQIGFNLLDLPPYAFLLTGDFTFALIVLELPQLPMPLVNADLSINYFPQDSKGGGLPGALHQHDLGQPDEFFLRGMLMCHYTGGLASRYRFGASTGGSNLIISTHFHPIGVFLETISWGLFL